jgi:antitoxin component of MazEF toxin-antitoxin module
MTTVTIGRWGNSLALRIPGDLAATVQLAEGCLVDIEQQGIALIITPATPRVSATTLFSGKSPAAWREEYADAYDWGADIGREIIAE